MNKKSHRFSPEVRERAVRLVQEHRGEYPSLCACIEPIAPKIACVPQTLNDWVEYGNEHIPQIYRVLYGSMRLFGAGKAWKHMNREGIAVARCTIERQIQTAL